MEEPRNCSVNNRPVCPSSIVLIQYGLVGGCWVDVTDNWVDIEHSDQWLCVSERRGGRYMLMWQDSVRQEGVGSLSLKW